MLIIFLFLLSANNDQFGYLLENATKLSANTHQLCLRSLPNNTENPQAYSALLCGKNITDEKFKLSLIKSSLIHLFVVSGSHLLLLEDFFIGMRIPFFLRFLLTGLYCLACNWQAPVVRAWVGLCARSLHKKSQLCLPADIFVFYSGLICLFLFPAWVSSRSLVMSWLAALALSIVRLTSVQKPLSRLLLQSTLIYLMMMPAVWGFGNLHPLSILFNIVLAPLVTFLLLPIALLSSVLNSWTPLFDKLCQLFFWLSEQGTEPVQIGSSEAISIEYLWVYIFASHLSIHFLRIYLMRTKRSL
jgi:competence protein ComEC